MKTLSGSLRFLLPLTLCAASGARAAEFKFPKHTFTVPDGFEVELVAGPPLVDRPIVADFDEQGRLYVADSSGSNDKVDKQLQDKPHRIVRLEDTDGDGRFDKSVVFADKMMFPEGTMWFNGSLYVGAPPSIWKLTDTDGDGVADQREEWFQGKTLTGCANDLHGPYLGPDGWIYWAKGAFAKQTNQSPGSKPFVTRAAHIFRARPDGTGLEPVMTGGMDNPVDVAFTPGGERIFTTTFVHRPEAGIRDGVVHAIYGGLYGKVNDVLDDHKATGDLMPVMVQFGPAAPCGLTRYESRCFGLEYQDNLFACLFNLHKVSRHVLEPSGATFRSKDSDFLASDNTDFHPTDVIEDADGSLLVVDTGGWYKLCCPTSQLYKPDVLGAIYRVRRKDAPKLEDPRGRKLAWTDQSPAALSQRLGDERPAVRRRAMQALAQQGGSAVRALYQTLRNNKSVDARRNAVWTLTRIEHEDAYRGVRYALNDGDSTVRQVAIHSTGLRRDGEAPPQLLRLLPKETPPVQRAAAEALGRIGHPGAVPELLALAGKAQDRALEHSLTYALIQINNAADTSAGLQSTNPLTKRAALIALDQMDGGGLKPEQVAPLLVSTEPALRQTASWLVSRHADWGNALAGFFRERLSAPDLGERDYDDLQRQLARFGRTVAIQELLATTLSNSSNSPQTRLTVLRAMAQTGVKETPPAWAADLARVLHGHNDALVHQAVATARSLPAPKEGGELTAALLHVARDASRSSDVRLEALAAVPGGLSAVEPELFDFLCASVAPAKTPVMRSTAAGVLAKAKLTPEQLLALTETLKAVGPLEVPKLLAAYEKATDETLGLKLVAALKQSSGVAGLRAETLTPRLTNFPETVRREADGLLASLNVDTAKQKAHLDELAAALKDGDVRRGQGIFNSTKAACSSCHAIGYLGGNIGPDLTRIGQIRTERDLLEAIVYPSASFVRSYEPIAVSTKSGDEYSGVLRRDNTDEIVLATGVGTEVRIARADITEMRPGTLSVMPSGLDEQLTRQELADLLAFLKATKW
jgi:putative membrane-bound dehydrogenase-like protein